MKKKISLWANHNCIAEGEMWTSSSGRTTDHSTHTTHKCTNTHTHFPLSLSLSCSPSSPHCTQLSLPLYFRALCSVSFLSHYPLSPLSLHLSLSFSLSISLSF